MRSDYPILYLARVVLEAVTPLSVSTGSPDGVFDSALVRDANGLPSIPGTSLAGVLRHLWTETHVADDDERIFGFQRGATGSPSRLGVSWGALLDSTGRPAEGLLIGRAAESPQAAKRLEDPLFAKALATREAPDYRNRVRLSHRGAAADTGKFDRVVLPAGNRFAVELRLQAPAGDPGTDWNDLLGLLVHPGLRLGGATRAGLGRVRCVALHQGRFDLTDKGQAATFLGLGRGLDDWTGLAAGQPPAAAVQGWLTGHLTLQARGLWRIGQGIDDLEPGVAKPADLLPVTEEQVSWTGRRGERTGRMLLIPGASVKGALAHRMAFHAARFSERWSPDTGPADPADPADPAEPALPEAVAALLGAVKDRGGGEDVGRAGCLFIDDAFAAIEPERIARLMHNAIDRFTGGVRDRVLYEEESLHGGSLAIEIALDLRRLERTDHAQDARRALRAALDDLCRGRLALGSRTTTGNGFFTGELAGTLADWLHAETHDQDEEAA